MNAFRKALEDRGLSVPEAVRQSGGKYLTDWKQFTGERRVSAEMALFYERRLGIPAWELRPDLWAPPGPEDRTSLEKGEDGAGGGHVVSWCAS